MRFELHRCTAPTLVITGSQDMLTPFGDAEELAEMIPGARLRELRGAAHGLMVEQPNAFNSAVLEFLREVDVRSGRLRADPDRVMLESLETRGTAFAGRVAGDEAVDEAAESAGDLGSRSSAPESASLAFTA